MQFITESDRFASEAQRRIRELRLEQIQAAEAGDMPRFHEIEAEIGEAAGRLAQARSIPALAECRHCGEAFEPADYVELVISAIVVHKRQIEGKPTETETMIFPRGEERHQVYCSACAESSGLLDYLGRR